MTYVSNNMSFPVITETWEEGTIYSTYKCPCWFDSMEELQAWCDAISGAAYL